MCCVSGVSCSLLFVVRLLCGVLCLLCVLLVMFDGCCFLLRVARCVCLLSVALFFACACCPLCVDCVCACCGWLFDIC